MTRQALVETGKCIALREAEEVVRHTAPKVEGGPRYCIWMERGLVSYKLCTRHRDCGRCAFGQSVQEAGW